jgi:hypothetical protein
MKWLRAWLSNSPSNERRRPRNARTASSYALVLRPKTGGAPWVRFDNAHAVTQSGRGRGRVVHDHWHRTEHDEGRPYEFTTASKLLDDFWREVKRTLDEKDIPHDL